MSNELTVIDTDTQVGALKQEAHWTMVLAATGGGLTFTWIWHLMQWTPLNFAVHGVAGAVGGYLVGTGLSRALTGVRARPYLRRYEPVSNANRVIASGIRLGAGGLLFYLSYLWAVGFHIPGAGGLAFDPAMLGAVIPVGFWVLILFMSLGRGILRAAR